MAPNDYEVDTFIASWAPTKALREELLKLYEPVASRFDDQGAWISIMERAIKICHHLWPNIKGIVPEVHSLSQYMSVHLVLDLVRTNEQLRGRRYDRIVVARPDALIHREIQLAWYPVDLATFHNVGNHNTGDMFFVLSSTSAEKLACMPMLLPSAAWFGSMNAHSIFFVPMLVPFLTGKGLSDNGQEARALLDEYNYKGAGGGPEFAPPANGTYRGWRLPEGLAESIVPDRWLRYKVVYPYRKQNFPEWCAFPSYDHWQRRRCAGWDPTPKGKRSKRRRLQQAGHKGDFNRAGGDAYDSVCASLKRQEDPRPACGFP